MHTHRIDASALHPAMEPAVILRSAGAVWLNVGHAAYRADLLPAAPPPLAAPAAGPWEPLHRWAAAGDLSDARAWLDAYQAAMPDRPTDRRGQFARLRQDYPPAVASRPDACWWAWSVHADVERRLGRRQPAYADVAGRWGWPADDVEPIHVHHSATGLGDAVCGLYAVCGLADAAGRPVVYHTHSAGWLGRFAHPRVRMVSVDRGTRGIDINGGNAGYAHQIRFAATRCGHYAENLSKAAGVPPFAPRPPAVVDRAVHGEVPAGPYALLSPFSAYSSREWPEQKWAELARRLHAAGIRVVAAGSAKQAERLARVFGPTDAVWIHGRDGDAMADLLLGAAVVVGNDSGVAHYAGMLGVPTVAVHAGSLSHDFLFGMGPSITSVTPGRSLPRTDHNTAELATIEVDAVVAAVSSRL